MSENNKANVEKALKEATDYADKHNLTFGFYPAYGMGGQYLGDKAKDFGYEDYQTDNGWVSSSQGC